MFFVAAAVAMISLSSCKKDWVCECTTTDADGNEYGTTTSSFTAKKKDAESSCSNLETSSGGATTSCELSEK